MSASSSSPFTAIDASIDTASLASLFSTASDNAVSSATTDSAESSLLSSISASLKSVLTASGTTSPSTAATASGATINEASGSPSTTTDNISSPSSSNLALTSTDSNGSFSSSLTNSSVSTTSRSISAGAIAGIVVGIVLVLLTIAGIWFCRLRRSKRQHRRQSHMEQTVEKERSYPSGRVELVGTIPGANEYQNGEPELEGSTLQNVSDSSSRQSELMKYHGGAGAPVLTTSASEGQRPKSPAIGPHGATGQPDDLEVEPQPQRPAEVLMHEDVNVLKAQQRELVHRMEATESLQQLRAEQAALQDRIRLAEMREREIYGTR